MDRLKLFDRALLEKQIGGIGLIVILDTIYLITGVFFGRMDFQFLLRYVIFVNMLTTCILYHNFIVSRSDYNFELNTEKMVYYPTTRLQYLWNKYAKTLLFLIIQSIITLISLWFGYYGNRGQLDVSRIVGSLLAVFIGILLTSGCSILVMHTMPMGIYLSMFLYIPLSFGTKIMEKILTGNAYLIENIATTITLIILVTILIWSFLLLIGVKVYEAIN